MSARSTSAIRPLPRRRSVGADIAEQLRDLIQSGTYQPGDRLPGQRELAQQFGTSLAGVREAVSVLSAAGMVSATPGRGTVVRSVGDAGPTFDGWLGAVGDEQEFEELMQARRMLEAFTIAHAAGRAAPADIARLRGAVGDMRAALDDPGAYAEADMRFHLLLSEVAGNRVVTRLMRAIQRPLMEQLRRSIAHLRATGQLGANLATHERIVDGIEQRDLAGAQRSFEDMLAISLAFGEAGKGEAGEVQEGTEQQGQVQEGTGQEVGARR